MSEAERKWFKKDKPTFIMVPRVLLITWFVTQVVLVVMILASFQYANYVDRKSNQYWCGIVDLFNDTYKETPPPTRSAQILNREFIRLHDKFKCK